MGRLKELVGEAGFEPATPWPPAKCAAGLRYSPNQASILRFLATTGFTAVGHLNDRLTCVGADPAATPTPPSRGGSPGCDSYSAGARASSTHTLAAALRWPANAS